MPNPPTPRPAIRFTGGSADAEKIRFFGTLMPALMLMKEAPLQIVANALQSHLTPGATAPERRIWLAAGCRAVRASPAASRAVSRLRRAARPSP